MERRTVKDFVYLHDADILQSERSDIQRQERHVHVVIQRVEIVGDSLTVHLLRFLQQHSYKGSNTPINLSPFFL